MKVAGFSFIRNGQKYDYPFVEAIKSVLPMCDEFIVAVGTSEDDTLKLVKNIDPKVRIVETVWDDTLREGGRVLAVETDKAFQAIGSEADWCFYIQGDEVIHEKYHKTVLDAMQKWKDEPNVDGLLFNYLHFYGSYDYVGTSSRWYAHEIRVVKNNKNIYSFRDAQGFRKDNDKMLNVKPIDAFIYHYGWVRDPRALQNKMVDFHKLWYSDDWVDKNIAKANEFDYSTVNALELFTDTHPKPMHERIEKRNWKFDHDISLNKLSLKDKFKRLVKKYFGITIAYKNYKIV